VWENIKKRLKSKTYWAAIAMSAMTLIEMNLGLFQPMLGDWYLTFYLGMTLVFMAIREATNAPLSEK